MWKGFRSLVGRGFRKSGLVFLPALLLLLGTGISYRLAFLQHSSRNARLRDQLDAELDTIRGDLSRELFASMHLTQGIVSLVTIEGDISQERFQALAKELLRHNSLIRNVALAPGNVVRFIYPLAGNERAIGLNYLEVPSQRDSVLRAMAEKRLVIAGPVALVQGGVGIIGRAPIFVADPGHGGRQYWGISATVIDFQKLLEVVRLPAANSRRLIALRGKDGTGASGAPFWGDPTVFDSEPVAMDVTLPSGNWQIAAVPAEGWPKFNFLSTPLFLTSWFITLAFSLLLFQVMRVGRIREREVVEKEQTEAELRQTNRALRLFTLCNGVVVHAKDEASLLDDICRIAVESAGYRMAWVGRAEQDAARTVKPITFAGPGEGFLDRIHVSWGDNEYGQATAGTAIRTRSPAIARDLLRNPAFVKWRDVLMTRDFAAAIAVPLIVGGEIFGVLLIYASEPDAFDSTEVGLIEDLGRNISHGMTALRLRKERGEAIAALQRTQLELEARVIDRTRELQQAKEAAESADRIKSAFLATMSHELRTPLNSIIGFTGIMLQGLAGPLNPEQQKQLGMVQTSAQHLLALINDVLDISKIEAGQLQVFCRTFDLRNSLEKVVHAMAPLAEKKGLKLQLELDPHLGSLHSDQRRVEQILMNLLSNAIKFTENGEVRVRGSVRNDWIEVMVSDTGIGIKPEDLSTLFLPFRQVETGLARRHEGTGLGLSICKRLLELLHGTIHVQSESGLGSMFTIQLPLAGGSRDSKDSAHHRG